MKIRTMLLAGATSVAGVAGTMAAAQTGPQEPGQLWGAPVQAGESSEVIRSMGDQLGMIRSNQLFWQQLNALEFTGNGSWVDLEGGASGEMTPVSKYTFAISMEIPASRLDVEAPQSERLVRVVRGDLDTAWDESRPGYVSGDSDNATYREALIWFWPHAFARAAAYAEQGLCPDGSECDVPVSVSDEGGSSVITVEINGIEYRATLGEDDRPAEIVAEIEVPELGATEYVASYSNYRNGLGLGASGEEVGEGVRGLAASTDVGAARGEGILDKFHTGAYFPGNIAHSAGGQPVLELEVTEGWPNAYMVFPTPEQLASAQ